LIQLSDVFVPQPRFRTIISTTLTKPILCDVANEHEPSRACLAERFPKMIFLLRYSG
jgi:hypothetical protein